MKDLFRFIGNLIGYAASAGAVIWVLRAFIIIAIQGEIRAYEPNPFILYSEIFMHIIMLLFVIYRIYIYVRDFI